MGTRTGRLGGFAAGYFTGAEAEEAFARLAVAEGYPGATHEPWAVSGQPDYPAWCTRISQSGRVTGSGSTIGESLVLAYEPADGQVSYTLG